MATTKASDRGLVRSIVVLIRNTTWRCGRLERSIVKFMRNRHSMLGKKEMPVNDLLLSFNVTGKKRNEVLDAIRRLERRNIIRILRFVN